MVFEREGANEGNNVTTTHCILIPPLVITMLLWTAGAAPQEDVLKPYDGPSVPGVDPTTLAGKVMTGYQGWFNCPDDGAGLGPGTAVSPSGQVTSLLTFGRMCPNTMMTNSTPPVSRMKTVL